MAILRDAQKYSKLQLELAAVIDAGEPFAKATHNLNGDGPLVFGCFEALASLSVEIRTAHFPNLSAISAFKAARLFVPQKVTEMQPTANAIDDLVVFPFLN